MFHDTHGWQIKHYNSVKETSRLYNTWIIFDKQKQPNSSRNLLFSLSLPGFRNFMDPNKSKFQKRLWLIIVVCCCCLSIVQISERVYYFQQYPVSMTITFERSTDFYFPKICLCHFHSFLSNKIRERLNYSSYRSLNKRLLQHPNLTVDDLWKLTGYDLETFLIDVSFINVN